jgi:tetratricopeptide (TPR) repeat protein
VVSTPELEALLEQAIVDVNAGDLEQGRALLERVLEQDPKNDRAWVWLSGCVEDPRQRRICLQQALNANPNNQAALDGMQALEGKLVQASQVPPSLLESRLSAIGMGNQVSPRPSSVSPPPSPEAAAVAPIAAEPTRAVTGAIGEPMVEETAQKPRWGRVVILVAIVLFLFLVVCALVGTQVVPILRETFF